MPTIVDDTLAPKGKHVVNLFGGHAPYHLKDARWEESKDAFFKTVVDTVSEFAPNFRDSIIHAQVLAPPDPGRPLRADDVLIAIRSASEPPSAGA